MKQIFRLKVPAEPTSEFVSHGNIEFELTPNAVIEVTNGQVAVWLVNAHGLELIETVEAAETETTPQTGAEQEYPEGFPGREALIEANVPFEQVKNLTAEQLTGYKGIGEKTAAAIVEFFAAGGNE